jgi:glyoxylase-like metal-dependent hydrolase (beta-lactamase superfamily II)
MLKLSQFGKVTRFDIARTLFGRGRYWTAAYLVDGLIVDTGCAHAVHEVVEALEAIPIRRMVNTHSHEDHIGANGALQRRYEGLEILAHPLALPVMADPRGTQPLQPYRLVYWGYPEPSRGQPVPDGAEIATEDYLFKVIYTPGHSVDHLCLYEPQQGWLFTGDLFVGGRDRALRHSYDIWGIIASLKKISTLPAEWMFPGSARVRENPAEEIKDKVTYLEEMGGRVLDLHRKGWSVRAITREVCGKVMRVEVFTLGHFSRRRLVMSYLKMGEEG